MRFVDVFRLYYDTDLEYYRSKTPLGVRGDVAIDPEPSFPGNWHRFGTKTCNIDFLRDRGWTVPDYGHGKCNGIGHNAILSEGKINEPFVIATADGFSWRVLEFSQDFNDFLYVRLEYLGQFDFRATA